MDILITDVTNIRTRLCVAGWDMDGHRMVRPLQGAGGYYWDVNFYGPHCFAMGNVVRVVPIDQLNDRDVPHKNEDLLVRQHLQVLPIMAQPELIRILRLTESDNVQSIFNGNLINRKYVDYGIDCASLGAVSVPVDNIVFQINRYNKFRCLFSDHSGTHYDMPVVSRELNNILNGQDINEVNNLRVGCATAHIRIGLAGKMEDNNDRCYAMVNNVYFY